MSISNEAQKLKKMALERCEYLVEDGHQKFEARLTELRGASDEYWETLAK
jgi:hypothetical protein